MKKALNLSLIYAVFAMIGGVFYREFTKFNHFTGVTALRGVHAHLFLLGMVMFLLVALFAQRTPLEQQKGFRLFMVLYNIGVALTAVMMAVRGVMQVLAVPLSSGASASISGMAGIGHILTGAGIILLLVSLKRAVQSSPAV